MKHKSLGVLGLLILLILTTIVTGTYITIQISTDVNETSARVAILNLGDEAALQVQIDSMMLNRRYESEIQERLEINEGFVGTFPINLTNQKPGNYPLYVTVNYQDANRHPFSALSLVDIKNSESTRSDIFLELDDAEIDKRGRIKVVAKNLGDEQREVEILLFTAKEFVIKKNPRTLRINPKSGKKITFDMDNLAARQGSNYPIYAVAEYDYKSKHFTSIGTGSLFVKKRSRIFNQNTILIALGILLLIFIIIQKNQKK